jgi:hypothetical protein
MPNLNERPQLFSILRIMLLTMVAGIFVGGCVTSETVIDVDPNSIVDPHTAGGTWKSPAGRMGLLPIMPPSEDVRVGDMFVYPFNPDIHAASVARSNASGLSTSPRWATLSLLEALEQEYELRPAWPGTPDSYLQISDNPKQREWAEPVAPENQSIFARGSATDRLRNFGIPEFHTFTLAEGDVNALLPTEVINLVLGSAWNDDKALTIRLNSAETYSLGLQKIIEIALEESEEGFVLDVPYREHLSLVADPLANSVWIRLLSDVVYIRSIDFIIQSKSGFETDEVVNASEFVTEIEETETRVVEESSDDGAADNDAINTLTDGAASEPDEEASVAATVTETISESLPDHELDPVFAAFVRANAINEILIESDSDDLPGGFLRFISVTDDSVTLRRIWKRGLAVGSRGLTLEVDKLTGEILRSGNMGTLMP